MSLQTSTSALNVNQPGTQNPAGTNTQPVNQPSGENVQPTPPGPTRQKRALSQVDPRPAGGIKYSFTSGQPLKFRKVDPKDDVSTSRTTGEAEDTDEHMKTGNAAEKRDEEKAKKEERDRKIATFLSRYGGSTQEEGSGAIKTIGSSHGHPRYTPYREWTNEVKTNADILDRLLDQQDKQEENWVWMQVYKTQTPEEVHIQHFKGALGRVERWQSDPDFKADDYEPMLVKKPRGNNYPVIPVFCKTKEARGRILKLGSFTYLRDDREHAFFIQGPTSIGSMMILEFWNAPLSEEHFLKGVFRALKDIILWKNDSQEDQLEAVHLQFAKIPWTDKQQGAKGNRWQVAFCPDPAEIGKWRYPETAGNYGATGEILIKTPFWCHLCI